LERRNRQTGDGLEDRWENLLDLKPQFLLNPWPPIPHISRSAGLGQSKPFHPLLGWVFDWTRT
jgi:hypothetical protein